MDSEQRMPRWTHECPHAAEEAFASHLQRLETAARLFTAAKKKRRFRLVLSEQWLCLQCTHVGCPDAAHVLGVSLRDLRVFCDTCATFVAVTKRMPALAATLRLLRRALFRERLPAVPGCLPASSGGAPVLAEQRILKHASIESFAHHLRKHKCSSVLVLTGAGISTSAGIPDFRTPGTGLYDNLGKYNLPSPQSIFDIDFFRRNPNPFFLLARELYPGNFKPTPGHFFIKLLAEKGILLRNFTQNIDTLEREAGIREEFLVEAHGSFASAKCVGGRLKPKPKQHQSSENESNPNHSSSEEEAEEPFTPPCGATYTQEWVKEQVFAGKIPTCENPDCPAGLVKPDITFFGEQLPARFFTCLKTDFAKADAVIVMGSSLKVSPFAMLPLLLSKDVPRLLINNEVVGNFNPDNGKDAVFLGSCDDGCRALAALLGLEDELEEMIQAGAS